MTKRKYPEFAHLSPAEYHRKIRNRTRQARIAEGNYTYPPDPTQRCRKLRSFYGITEAQYDAMLEAQGGGCALCGKVAKNRSLHVDHCHETGRVRGILCPGCNGAIGMLGDTSYSIRRVADYIDGIGCFFVR